jgi:hypothetical protein
MRDQTTARTKPQCARVLAGFSGQDWCEVEARYLFVRRLGELKIEITGRGGELGAEKEGPAVQVHYRCRQYVEMLGLENGRVRAFSP